MRLKKLMSLVLACAMALSLITVASAADTKVYLVEDFSGYETINDLTAVRSNPKDKNLTNAVSVPKAENAKYASVFYTTNYGRFDHIGGASFITNEFGNKAVSIHSPQYQMDNVGSGYWYLIPDEAWDMSGHMDETYVVSYEFSANPAYITASASSWYEAWAIWGSEFTVDEEGYKTWTTAPIGMQSFISTIPAGTTSTTTATEPAADDDEIGTTTVKSVDPETQVETIVKTTVAVVDEVKTKTIETTTNTPAAAFTIKASDHRWNQSGKNIDIYKNTTYRIALGYQANSANTKDSVDYCWPTKIVAVDGAQVYTNNQQTAYNNGIFGTNDKFVAINFTPQVDSGNEYGNIKMYTIKNNSFKAYVEDNTDVPLNKKTIRVKFANPVAPATFSNAVVVKKGGVEMDADQYAIGTLEHYTGPVDGEIYSYVDVTFAGLEEGTTYTIDFADTIANEIGNTLGETNSVATFSTKAPDVKLMPLSIVGAESLVADDDNIQAVKANLVNNTAASKNVALIYAVYTSAGQLSDVVYVNETVEETAEIEVGLKLAVAGTLKAFAWDNITAIKPYTGSQELTIAAPAVAE